MFDREALELIQNTAVKAAGASLALDGRALMVPDGINLMNTEPFSEYRHRFRGTYSTSCMASFIGYVNGRGNNNGNIQVFVEPNAGFARAFFNLGAPEDPGHGDDVADLKLERTAPYSAMTDNCSGQRMDQQRLAEFLEDWAHCIVPAYGSLDEPDSARSLAAAIAAVRDITITRKSETSSVEKEMAASRSTLAQVEARSRNILPAGFIFTTSPFPGFQERQYPLRLSVIHGADEVFLALRATGLDRVKEEVADEFEAKMFEGLVGRAVVFRGSFTP